MVELPQVYKNVKVLMVSALNKFTKILLTLMISMEDGNQMLQEYSMLTDKLTHGRHLVYSQDTLQTQLSYQLTMFWEPVIMLGPMLAYLQIPNMILKPNKLSTNRLKLGSLKTIYFYSDYLNNN